MYHQELKSIYFIIKINYISLMHRFGPKFSKFQELESIESILFQQFPISSKNLVIPQAQFYHFVGNLIEILTHFARSKIQATLNAFIIEFYASRCQKEIDVVKKVLALTSSWRKFIDTDEGKLFRTLIGPNRNTRQPVRLFLRLRKILLKNINQKILTEVLLSHQDAVTIVHTLNFIDGQKKRDIIKKINNHFIKSNKRNERSFKFNAAVVCEYLMQQINSESQPLNCQTQTSNFGTSSTYNEAQKQNFIRSPKSQTEDQKEYSLHSDDQFSEMSFSDPCFMPILSKNKESTPFLPQQHVYDHIPSKNVKEIEISQPNDGSLVVDFKKCLQELKFLKEKDMQMDNRVKKFISNKASCVQA